jgi:AraC-like DNA-binding protein
MSSAAPTGLNVSGDEGVTRIVRGGAIHVSRGQQTSRHAQYAWKLHVGIDAPVWLKSSGCSIPVEAGARVVLAPPGLWHSTGAVGESYAVFIAPGSRATPWRATSEAFEFAGAAAERIVSACQRFDADARESTTDFIAELAGLAFEPRAQCQSIDARVEGALRRLAMDPDVPLPRLAAELGLSLDRLSRLVTQSTGMRLRQHALFCRLLRLLSANSQPMNLAAAAFDAGFSDHAHMTRSFRSFFGRAPSEFRSPPDAIEPW